MPIRKAKVRGKLFYEQPCSPKCDTFQGVGWPLGCEWADYSNRRSAKAAQARCLAKCSQASSCDACLLKSSTTGAGWVCAVERGKLVFGEAARGSGRFEHDLMWVKAGALRRYICRAVHAFGRKQGEQGDLSDAADETERAPWPKARPPVLEPAEDAARPLPPNFPKASPRDVQRKARGDVSTERFLAQWDNAGAEVGTRPDPVLGFVVPSYQQSVDSIVTTVRSLVAQDLGEAPHFPAVVIVAVDGDDTASAEAAVDKVRTGQQIPPGFSLVVLGGAWRGLAGTRNRAINSFPASVEWVMPVDCGDTIEADFLTRAAAALRQDRSLNYVMPLLCIASRGYKWNPKPLQESAAKLHEENQLHCCVLYRRELFDAVGGYEPAMSFGWEDWDFWTRANHAIPLRGFVVGGAEEKCSYTYRADGMHKLCDSSKEQCNAAFVIASGGLYGTSRVKAAHATILAAPDFALRICQAHSMSGGNFRTLSPLRALFCGLSLEAAHQEEDALSMYSTAARLIQGGIAPSRGIEWQASRLATRMLKRAHNLPGLARWCKTTTGMTMHPNSRGAAALTDLRWLASGCAFAHLVPARVRAPGVECDERFGELMRDGSCVCMPGHGGGTCTMLARAHVGTKPRVCMFTKEFGNVRLGGIGSAFTHLASLLALHGFPVQVILAEEGIERTSEFRAEQQTFRRKGIELDSVQASPRHKATRRYHMQLAYMVYEWARRHESECDIMHYHDWFGLGYYLSKAKKEGIAFGAVTLVAQLHGTWSWALSNQKVLRDIFSVSMAYAERKAVENADVVVSCSQYMIDHLRSYYGAEIEAKRAHIIQNTLQTREKQTASMQDVEKLLRIRELVFFGKTDFFKGIDIFCDAIDIMLRSGQGPPAVTFLVRLKAVTRDGEQGDAFIDRRSRGWKESGVEVSVVTGQSSSGCMRYLKGKGRLAVMPSVLENSPYVVLEAIGNFVPFVATAVGGTPELLHPDDRPHALVPYAASALAERLSQIVVHGQRLCRPAVSFSGTEGKWLELHTNGLSVKPAAPKSLRTCTASGRDPPLVSVIVPTHNRATVLPRTIAAIWALTYAAIEIVFVDDASTDADVPSALEQLHSKYSALTTGSVAGDGYFRSLTIVRNKVNSYLGASRNHGAQKAEGSLLVFTDDDDPILPSSVANMVAALCRRGLDMIGARPWYVPRGVDIWQTSEVPNDPRSSDWLIAGGPAAEGVLLNAFSGPFTMFMRTSFLSLGGFTKMRAGCEDWEIWSQATQAGLAIDKMTEPQYVYKEGGGGMFLRMSDFDCKQRILRWARGAMPKPLQDLPELSEQMYMHLTDEGVS